ncbi:MAG: hypothetical protein ACFB9M_06185 [Myxococcota bacterium]
MRIAWVATRREGDVELSATRLADRGHEMIGSPASRSGRGLVASAVSVARDYLGTERPDVTLLEWDAGRWTLGPGWAAPSALMGSRVPTVLWPTEALAAEVENTRGWRRALIHEAARAAARSARAIVTRRTETAERLERHLGIRGVTVLYDGLDLTPFLPLERDQAKEGLNLPQTRRFISLTAPLDPDVRVDLLALAHRKIPGVGLLVAADGPGLTAVNAMAMATRPSSPVLVVPPSLTSVRYAIGASDLGLSLRPEGPGRESWLYAGMGRRQVGFQSSQGSDIRILTGDDRAAIDIDEPTPEGLRDALERGLRASADLGPLTAASTEAVRMACGDWVQRLERVLAECA